MPAAPAETAATRPAVPTPAAVKASVRPAAAAAAPTPGEGTPAGQVASETDAPKTSASRPEAAPAPRSEAELERAMAVFRQLRMQLTPATRHAVLHLVPAELGRIRIHLSVRGGRVSGEIRADREETLAILEAHAPELRAALEQSGFDSADLQLARHGDPSPGRSGEPSSTSGRARSEPVPAAETLPDPVRSILRADRVDTIA